MFSIWTLITITVIYIALLFVVATIGNRAKKLPKSIYSFALGIHCTSWAFFGTTTQASEFGWPLVPTYLGIVLVMLFGFKLLLRVHAICKQYNVSSIAEFISVRYQHSNALALVVTSMCFIGVIPYIALQLDAITSAIGNLVSDNNQWTNSINLTVTLGMALFAIYFGARKLNLVEGNSGLMLTIAFQSIVKLVALLIVGVFIVYWVFDGFLDLFTQSVQHSSAQKTLDQPFAIWVYLSHVLLGICSMFCLPRQFHVNFIECQDQSAMHQARWLFPLYLLGMSAFVLPIALAGSILFANGNVESDSYVLAIPQLVNANIIVIIAFIGGLAASSSMVIVATLALGNMVANSLITPLLFQFNKSKISSKLSTSQILRIRQTTILVMMFIAYWYHVSTSQQATLVETGTIAISLLSQTLPAIIIGLVWQRAHKWAVLSGLVVGILTIVLGLLWPALQSNIQGTDSLHANYIAQILFVSLALNIAVLISFSYLFKTNAANPYAASALRDSPFVINYAALVALLQRLLPSDIAQTFIDNAKYALPLDSSHAPDKVLLHAESVLSSHIGSASTRILLNSISEHQSADTKEITELAVRAGKDFQFNKDILQASITHLPLGISVVDTELKLVAWNDLYETLFEYPKGFLHVGLPIVEVLEFNAKRGLFGDGDSQDAIEKRMQNIIEGRAYKAIRGRISGKVIEISGNALPAGGFITCYSDITEYIDIQQALESAKQDLEQRVASRTLDLEKAKNEAESANLSKTKFLAATSHDLMQPINAASLFASMLNEKLKASELQDLSENLLNSLDNAESLLSMLIEITKLENNRIRPSVTHFNLHELLHSLYKDFNVIAKQKSIELIYVPTSVWVKSDKRLLSRVLQNLLSNAIRYTEQGRIILGVRRKADNSCELIVQDTGKGIEQQYQQIIFTEFQRIDPSGEHPGLGLGLTIVERIAKLLGLKLSLASVKDKGTRFGLTIEQVKPQHKLTKNSVRGADTSSAPISQILIDKKTLVLENDPAISKAFVSLLSDWGSEVYCATDMQSAIEIKEKFDVIIADYHLNNGENGIDVCKEIKANWSKDCLLILSSADRSEAIQARAYENNMRYLPKPVKQAALKRLIQSR